MKTLPMKKTFTYPEQFNVRVTTDSKKRIENLIAQGVEFSDVAREYIDRAIQDAEDFQKKKAL